MRLNPVDRQWIERSAFAELRKSCYDFYVHLPSGKICLWPTTTKPVTKDCWAQWTLGLLASWSSVHYQNYPGKLSQPRSKNVLPSIDSKSLNMAISLMSGRSYVFRTELNSTVSCSPVGALPTFFFLSFSFTTIFYSETKRFGFP